MSHPVPGRVYGENEYPAEDYVNISKQNKRKIAKRLKKGGMIGKLKEMTKEPASKEWFKKYGLPKSIKNHPLKKK